MKEILSPQYQLAVKKTTEEKKKNQKDWKSERINVWFIYICCLLLVWCSMIAQAVSPSSTIRLVFTKYFVVVVG